MSTFCLFVCSVLQFVNGLRS